VRNEISYSTDGIKSLKNDLEHNDKEKNEAQLRENA